MTIKNNKIRRDYTEVVDYMNNIMEHNEYSCQIKGCPFCNTVVNKLFKEIQDNAHLMKTNEYKCEACGKIYEKGLSDKDANKEAKKIWGVDNASKDKNMAIICDDCFKKRSPQEIKLMGEEYEIQRNK